jgi:hypothetical protein
MSRCFAYSTVRQRCDQEAGHEGDHSVTAFWSDEECFDPMLQMPVAALPKFPGISGGGTVLTNAAEEVNAITGAAKSPSDICFGCDCPRVLHEAGGCAEHGCKTFID